MSNANPMVEQMIGGPNRPGQPAADDSKGSLNIFSTEQRGFNPGAQAQVHADGTFEAKGLLPGHYRVNYMSPTGGTYVESITYGNQTVPGDGFEIGEGGAPSIRVTLGAKMAQAKIDVSGEPSGDDAPSSWMVLFLSTDDHPWNQAVRGMLPIDRGNSSQTMNIVPGKYLVIALPGSIGQQNFNGPLAGLVRSLVQPVELTAGNTQTVSPHFFGSDELYQRALAYVQGQSQ
jgi:hypothetical protein